MAAECISSVEADHIVRELRPFTADDVGSAAWKEQRHRIEQLNMASHKCAMEKRDDYVLRSLLAEEKLPVLLHELLVAEGFRRKVFPEVTEPLVRSPVGVYMYTVLESLIVNFFECILFHAETPEGFGDDILELIEYCWRNVAADLIMPGDAVREIPESDPKVLMAMPEVERWALDQRNAGVVRSLSCITILWFIIDRMGSLPLAVKNAVLSKHDLIVGLSEVLCQQPWLRRTAKKTQKFVQGAFKDVSREDAMLVCSPEAHAWFAMHYLLCDLTCRKEYGYTQHKKERIIRVKRFLNETLVDQIPALVDVQRALEELSFMEPPVGTEEKFRTSLIVEHVPRIRAVLDRTNWRAVKDKFLGRLLDPESVRADALRLAELFNALSEAQ